MEVIDTKATGDDWTDACTIQGVNGSSGGSALVASSGGDAYVSLQSGPPGQYQWTADAHVAAGSSLTLLAGTTGIRFRSYTKGTAATVSASISGHLEPPLQASLNSAQVNTGGTLKIGYNGTVVGTEPELNLIPGTNAALTVSDNVASGRVDATVGVVASPTFTGTVVVNGNLQTDGNLVAYGGYGVVSKQASGVVLQGGTASTGSTPDGSGFYYADVTFPSAFAHGVLSLQVTITGGAPSGATVGSGSVTTSGFRVLSAQPSDGVYWFAMGY